MLIDTHAHIYLDQFSADLDEAVTRAKEVDVSYILMPNIDETSVKAMHEVEERYPELCRSMMGLHPCSVNAEYKTQLDRIGELLDQRNYLAVGEMGTDLYWDKTFWKEQQEAFNVQCQWAMDKKLPIVIHCRETIDQTIELVRPWADQGLTGVFHCFTGSVDQGQAIQEMGFYLGLGGVSTFKNGGLDQVIPYLAKNQCILETDSPYLAPVPFRGKRNEPAYVSKVADKVAEYWALKVDEVADITTENAHRLFQI